jgi:ApaG protein
MEDGFTATTRSLEVTVQPFFLEDQSDPEESRYTWAYRVRVRNGGSEVVQLIARRWKIVDGRGQVIEVEGPGVVGEQPVLEAGDTFEYTSGTPLNTPSGFMQGAYRMIVVATGEAFEILIPAFSLDSPYAGGQIH